MQPRYFEYSEDLLHVGKSKALGYLPLATIREYGGEYAVTELLIWVAMNSNEGLRSMIITEGHTMSGALYIWDDDMLMNIITHFKDVLTEAGIPVNSTDDFVRYLEHNNISSNQFPLAYEAIGICFNDKRFIPIKVPQVKLREEE